MSDGLHFLFGVHNHQPAGNFDSVVEDAVRRAYHPFLAALREVGGFSLTVHCSGGLLTFLRERVRPTFDLLGRLAADGQVELLTGGFYEPILPMLPDWDKIGQIQSLTEFLRAHFGVRPRGMWLAERVWEPHLPKALWEAGVEYVLLDDAHFALVGMEPDALGGYYVTEEQGATVAVFPINQRLRYLVPFADPGESLRYLESRRDAGAVSLVDDGEKFGTWPGTDRLVYGERWLIRFFEALRDAPWLTISTFSRYLDSHRPSGRVYLPAASYTEMGEWALPAAAAAELEECRGRLRALPDGERLVRLLRGGFWRTFLVKYPEVADTYWKVLGLSHRVQAGLTRQPGHERLLEARDRLWRGQENDAYWHGVFGGCYLPHLRRAVRSALIECEALLESPRRRLGVEWEQRDVNGDGRPELRVRNAHLALVLRPEQGGTLTELVWRAGRLDVGDVLTRRREAYHSQIKDRDTAAAGGGEVRTIHGQTSSKEAGLSALLHYDSLRRASLREGLIADGVPPDPLNPWDAAPMAIGDRTLAHSVTATADRVAAVFTIDGVDGVPLQITKTVAVGATDAAFEVSYGLSWRGREALVGRWATEFNLALTAGAAAGRYFRLPDRPSLGSRGRLELARELVMVDEWVGCELALDLSQAGEIAWAPVETVSLSEAGFERIYQGSALLLSWPVRLEPGETWGATVRVSLAAARKGDSP
ncbi:MAG TPA: alpha-amylase/4-alpha-glucanotransferase domain-containing protein [Methylomirabilota bacterium]|nr:alpha-amylase/4-alpha-glucanotransferase domain-containing protein [Methylomirabilota bacterium]